MRTTRVRNTGFVCFLYLFLISFLYFPHSTNLLSLRNHFGKGPGVARHLRTQHVVKDFGKSLFELSASRAVGEVLMGFRRVNVLCVCVLDFVFVFVFVFVFFGVGIVVMFVLCVCACVRVCSHLIISCK